MTDWADRGRKARLARPPEPPVSLRSKFVALTSSSSSFSPSCTRQSSLFVDATPELQPVSVCEHSLGNWQSIHRHRVELRPIPLSEAYLSSADWPAPHRPNPSGITVQSSRTKAYVAGFFPWHYQIEISIQESSHGPVRITVIDRSRRRSAHLSATVREVLDISSMSLLASDLQNELDQT